MTNRETPYHVVETPMGKKLRLYLDNYRKRYLNGNQAVNGNGNHDSERPDQSHHLEAVAETSSAQTLDSNTLAEAVESGQLEELPMGLLDGVFLLGSTNYDWRRGTAEDEVAVENLLNEAGITTYNPDMGDGWDWENHPKVEALGMSKFSTLAMRIENAPGLEDGSLGSLVEIGMAAFSAKLRGQKFLISFAPDFQDSLRDPGAIAQFEALKVSLFALESKHPELIDVAYNETREDFAHRSEAAAKEQRKHTEYQGLKREYFEKFAELRAQRLKQEIPFVTIFGSSAPYHESLRDEFEGEGVLIENTWNGAHNVSALYKGAYAEIWREVESYTDDFKRRMALQRAFYAEAGPKSLADILVCKVQSESISQAVITELGFVMDNAGDTGQQLVLLLEKYDVNLYVRTALAEQTGAIRRFINSKKETFDPEMVQKAKDILDQLESDPTSVPFSQIKKNKVLVSTPQFKKADNANRTRAVADAQLYGIQETVKEIVGELGIELFSISTDVTDFIQKSKLINSPEKFEGREAYYANFKALKAALDEQLANQDVEPKDAVHVIDEALNTIAPREKRFHMLTTHLEEVAQDAEFWEAIVQTHESESNEPYLSAHHLRLITKYVAPLHDLLKFLGDPSVQSIPDHEILVGLVTKVYLPKMGFSPEDTSFITAVISDHENIFKERGRTAFASSKDPIERAKALFFVMDTLTGAISEEDGVIKIDQAKLRSRFTDLYFRHIDLVAGKVFRPQWGKASIDSFIAVFDELQKTGITFEDGFFGTIIGAGLEAIDKASVANDARVSSNQPPFFDKQQTKEVNRARAELEALAEKY